ncbi:hypothetical protein ACKWTF_001549 [Chironomus riparius]
MKLLNLAKSARFLPLPLIIPRPLLNQLIQNPNKNSKPLKSKFSSEEAETNLDEQFDTSDANTETNELDSYPQTLNEARKRNKKIIEDLEKAKARLRMRVMFSPLDEIHEKAENNYFAAIQTPLKKKYGPIFV